MITLNLDEIKRKPHLLSILEELKHEKDSILLYDMPEGSRLWPLDNVRESNFSYSLFSKAHDILQHHNFDVWYLCSDLDIKNRYTKWCKKVGIEKKFNILVFPFTVALDSLKYIKQEYINNLTSMHKKKNFMQLMCSPDVYRIKTVDRYYKHRNYDYSFLPHFHNKNRLLDTIKLKNGFDTEKNVRILTEIDIDHLEEFKKYDTVGKDDECVTVNGKIIWKYCFNSLLPKESFESCCDIVLETYLDGPSYYTEKTWKQFFFQKPFIMIGAKGMNHNLQDLGFVLYDEIFDYDYDLEDTISARLDGFWAQIDRYLELEVSEFENKLVVLKEKLIHNRKIYIDWITNIDNFLNIETEYELAHYLYLGSTFFEKEYLPKDKFEIIKKICLGFY